jgi:hypothetical protein
VNMAQAVTDDWMAAPAWWLVSSLEWPGGAWAEGAVATSPEIARRMSPLIESKPVPISGNLEAVLLVGDRFASERGVRVVMFSDLTMWLYERRRTDWNAVGVDWQSALDEIQDRSPGLLLTIHQRAHPCSLMSCAAT